MSCLTASWPKEPPQIKNMSRFSWPKEPPQISCAPCPPLLPPNPTRPRLVRLQRRAQSMAVVVLGAAHVLLLHVRYNDNDPLDHHQIKP